MLWYTPRTEQKPPNLTDSLTLQEQEEYCVFLGYSLLRTTL